MNPALVLTTVNASHSRQLDANDLVNCLLDAAAAKAVPGHMSAFFGDVAPSLQIAFANQFGISEAKLSSAVKAFAAYSGEAYPLAA
jgi:hypothetical protein